MDKWAIQKCEASSCGEWDRSSTVDCLLFKSTTSLSYDCSAEAHWFSASFAIPSFLHMGRLQIASSGNAQKTKRFQNIEGMASKHQISLKTPWLRSTKSLWKLHDLRAPNLYENSMASEHQISLKTPHRPELSEKNPKLGVGYWAPDWLKLERKREVGMKTVCRSRNKQGTDLLVFWPNPPPPVLNLPYPHFIKSKPLQNKILWIFWTDIQFHGRGTQFCGLMLWILSNWGWHRVWEGQTRAQRQGEFTVTTWVNHCDWPIKKLGTCLVFFRFLPWSFANELTIDDLLLKDGKMLNKKCKKKRVLKPISFH